MIDVKHMTKVYGKGEIAVKALNEVSFEVKKGEFVAIMGPSGSGKSTLMNMLGCLDTPTDGEYFLDETLVSQLSEKELAKIRNQKIGFIFQTYNLLPRLTAIKNVIQPMIYKGTPRKERYKIAEKALISVGLENRLNHKPSELSGGQRQRVAIARALVNDPQIILADEPTGNLDESNTESILAQLFELREDRELSIALITHERNIADRCDVVYELHNGVLHRVE